MNSDSQNIYQKYTLINEQVDDNLLQDNDALVGGTLVLKIKSIDRVFNVTRVEDGGKPDSIRIFGTSQRDYPDLWIDSTEEKKTDGKKVLAGHTEFRILDAAMTDATAANNVYYTNADAIDGEWKDQGSAQPKLTSGDATETEADPTLWGRARDAAGNVFKNTDTGDSVFGKTNWTSKFGDVVAGSGPGPDITSWERWK